MPEWRIIVMLKRIFKTVFSRIGDVIRKYPRIIVLFVFIATCLYALFTVDKMAIVFNDYDGVPVILYTLAVGGIMALFTFFESAKRPHRNRRGKTLSSWGAVIIIFLFHLYVLYVSL